MPTSYNMPLTPNTMNSMVNMPHNMNLQQQPNQPGAATQLGFQQFQQQQQQGHQLQQKHDQMSAMLNTESDSNNQMPYSGSLGSFEQVQQQQYSSHGAVPQIPSSSNFQFPLLQQQQHQQQQQQHHQQVFSMQQHLQQQQQQHLLPQTHISHRMGMSSSGGANLAPVGQQPVVSSSSATDFGALANRSSSQLKPNSYLVNNNNNNINIWPAIYPEASGVDINDSSGHLSGLANQPAQSVCPVNFVVASDVSISLPDFNGGWQSNADIPDRRDMIVKIIKIIEKVGPDANKMATR